MTIDIDQYKRLRAKADKAKSDIDKAEGSRDQLMKKLLEDFECTTIDEAELKHKELKSQSEELEAKYEFELKEFEEEFGEKI